MDPRDFADARDLVLELLEQEPAARRRRLADEHTRRPAVARIVERLLRFDDGAPPLDPSPAGSDPTHVGRYPIRRRLGEGGMGVVYEAEDPDLARLVAIKLLPSRLAAEPPALEQLREEARLLARLNHPNIATIHSLETAAPHVFLTMELVPGESLAERLADRRSTIDEALALADQIGAALEAAHAHEVVHRDLKPSNIILPPDGGAKVLDFGIARLMDAGGGPPGALPDGGRRPATTAIRGTPGYMSPEQLRGEPAHASTDLWAFGCLLYECLTGTPAFDGTMGERIDATLHLGPDLDRLPTGTPAALVDLVRRCLQKDPTRRPVSATQARAALAEVIEARLFERALARAGRATERAVPSPATTQAASRLPVYANGFFGRGTQVREVAELLGDERLVTLVGIGGCGKTRLAVQVALEIADRFDDGVRFVDLAAVRDPELLAHSVMSDLGLRDESGRSPVETITHSLAGARMLVVLDNCEHALRGCAALCTLLLERCAHVRLLATSRETLRVDDERAYALVPLPVPSTGTPLAQVREHGTIQLFADRARAADPTFDLHDQNTDAVVELCRQLDGLPLALELAAARARVLTPTEMLEHLRSGLTLLRSRAAAHPEHHASLAATLDWSYGQLTNEERQALRRLAVFVSGFTNEAVASMAESGDPLELVDGLVDKSLVVRRRDARGERSRFTMLETVRAFAHARLDAAGERDDALQRQFEHYRSTLSTLDLRSSEQSAWGSWFVSEATNLAALLDRAVDAGVPAVDVARLAIRLTACWARSGRWYEGRRLCEQLAATCDAAGITDSREVALLLQSIGELAMYQGDLDFAATRLTRSAALAEALDDTELLAGCSNTLGNVEKLRGNLERAVVHFDRALTIRRAGDDAWNVSGLLMNRAVTHSLLGHRDLAESDLRESLAVKRQIGDSRGVAQALNGLGLIQMESGAYDEARQCFEESLDLKRALGDEPGLINTLLNLGYLATDRFDPATDEGALEHARRCFDEALALAEELGDRPNIAKILAGLGWTAILAQDWQVARARLERSRSLARSIGFRSQEAWTLGALAALEEAVRDYDAARLRAVEAIRVALASGTSYMPEPFDVLAAVMLAKKEPVAAARLLARAAAMRDGEGLVVPPSRRAWHDDLRAQLDRQLTEGQLRVAWTEGRTADLETLLPPQKGGG